MMKDYLAPHAVEGGQARVLNYGGSTVPGGVQGLQRAIRFMDFHPPRRRPSRFKTVKP